MLSISKRLTTDVVVIGGGTAGVFAALGAKNAGVDVVLIEKNNILGGTMTQGMVCCPGLFHAWGKQIINGYGFEAVKRALKYEGRDVPVFPYKSEYHWHQQISLNEFFFACALDEMCKKANINVMLDTYFVDATEDISGVKVYIADKEGLTEISAKKAVDSSGNAYLTRRLGYKVNRSEHAQPSSLRMNIGGYDFYTLNKEEVLEKSRVAIENGKIQNCSSAEMILNCLSAYTVSYLHTDVGKPDLTKEGTELQINARKNALSFLKLVKSITGCEGVYIKNFATECGIRETVRVQGEYEITVDDYVSGKVFEDAVCYAFYPVDLHMASDSKKTKNNLNNIFLQDGIVPTVPYRSLIPKNSGNILCAGRIISSDQLANSGLRVEATCMATGQAAGVAAAIAAKGDMSVQKVPYVNLAETLLSQNAIVPNFDN